MRHALPLFVLALALGACFPAASPPSPATATPPGAPATSASPSAVASLLPAPSVTPQLPACSPPPCRQGEVYYCATSCPGGCGTTCATPTPSVSAAPATTGSATTGTPGPGPAITYLRASVDEADPGDTITLSWASARAVRAWLYHIDDRGRLGEMWAVAPQGIFTYTIPLAARNAESFLLVVADEAQRTAQAPLRVPLRCPDTWFFTPPPDRCPQTAPLYGPGAEQHFEHGVMLWNQLEGMIYVLFDDRQPYAWTAYADNWHEGDPESDPALTPPPGLYQPIRGFGLVWRTQSGVRARLGWAADTETGYTTALQRTAEVYSITYIRALDGGLYVLAAEMSGWEHR